MKIYTKEEVEQKSNEYFAGDDLASSTFLKYVLKNKSGEYLESSPDDMHRRLSKEFARIEAKFAGINQLNEETIYSYLQGFKKIVPQGSPMAGIGNLYQTISLSNCVVVDSPKDTMSSIVDTGKDLANLYKRRCGVGLNLSNLRPDGAPVSNSAGTSSGAWSFADFYSYITRMVGQGGRRGALMLCMDVRHPDIERFITMKKDLTKVTGANVSVMIRDDFMHAVEKDEDFTLRFPIDSDKPKFIRTIKAKALWQLIVDTATKTAEPGILMWDNMLKYLPAECYRDFGFKHIATNPCAELILSANDSCRLITINLKWFVKNAFTAEAYFDAEDFAKTVIVAQRLSDDLVELELERLSAIINSTDCEDEKKLFKKLYDACANGRRTGLGTHGLADCLARLCLRYDSDEALVQVEAIYKQLKEVSYATSVQLAVERGAFPIYNWDLEKDNLFIMSLNGRTLDDMQRVGRRNISLLTNAPTGSVSILSQTSSGIEPVFRNSYTRRKKKNHGDLPEDTDFVDSSGDRWTEFAVFHHNVKEWMNLNREENKTPDFFVTSDNINWERRVEVQAVIQKHIDHSVSSTINLPAGTSSEVVGNLYFKGWQLGLKGITVYIDGSRTGVLVSKKEEKKSNNVFNYVDAPKRPQEVPCDIYQVSVKGEKWTIIVGLYENKPYEVFGGLSENIEIPSKLKKGSLVKRKLNADKTVYDLKVDGMLIKDIGKVFANPTYQAHTRMTSLALRHGSRPSFLVEQLLKDQDSDLTSFSKVMARVIKKYVEDGTKVTSDKTCGQCAQENLVYADGCVSCKNCGWSKC